jgi:hypothetical protein
MRQTVRRGGPAYVGVRGATLVAIALFAMLLVPSLAAAIVSPAPVASAPDPVNTVAPVLTGTPAPGQTLTCSTGSWANNPTSFSYAWLRSGVPIAGQAGSSYVVQAADQGHTVSCQVTAGNTGGDYTISGLASGSYKVEFYPGYQSGNNYLAQFYNGKSAFTEANLVAVAAPGATGGINAELHAGGQISGVVSDATTHAGLGEVYVCADEVSNPSIGSCSYTGSNGAYTIVGLPTGSYTVEFDSLFSGYITQFYNGKTSGGEAEAVAVTVGTTRAGINAELHSTNQGGEIKGTVTRASGGATIEGIEVCASGTEVLGGCATTNASGEYTIAGLAEGSYTVSFSADDCGSSGCTQLNYINQYYNDKPSYFEATQVAVQASKATLGIDAQMAAGGEVEGRVTSASGAAPLANVQACAEEGSNSSCATTNANGEYKILGLPSGTSYIVTFSSYSSNYLTQFYKEKGSEVEAEHVAVKVGESTAGINAKLIEGGQIAGRVTDATTHAPVAEVDVCAGVTSGEIQGCASTNANGEYTISTLMTGTYQVNFYPEGEAGYLPQTETGISVTQGNLMPGVNAELHAGGQITGRVTDASTHAGITRIDVCADEIGGEGIYRCAFTTAGAASASVASNALVVPGSDFTQAKPPVYDAKKGVLEFFFKVATPGKFRWSLFFRNADVGFADSLGLSLGAGEGSSMHTVLAEAAKKKKAKGCKKGTIKHHGKCVRVLVPFGSGSQSVQAGTVEIKVHASSKAIKALNAGRTLHVSGTFTFQSSLGGKPVTHSVSVVVRKPKGHAKHAKKHGKGHKR